MHTGIYFVPPHQISRENTDVFRTEDIFFFSNWHLILDKQTIDYASHDIETQ